MKKLMIAASAALCATVSLAELASANIVGYNSVKIKGDRMNLLTVSFETVGNANGKATLKEVMARDGLLSFSEDGNTAGDYIDTWDMANGNWGKTYYYVNQPTWNDGDLDYTDTWMDADFAPANPEMESGSSFWLYHNGDDIASLTFAGQVGNSAKGYTLTGGRNNLCGNPFPTALDLGNKAQVVIANATSFSEDGNTPGDYIDTWDLTTSNWGKTYYYVNQPTWNDGDLDYTDTWMDADFAPSSTDIQAGAGFWYYAVGNGTTLTFSAL